MSHECVGTDDEPAIFGRQILLSDVYARGADRAGDVRVVVDDERDGCGHDAKELPRTLGNRAFFPVGGAQLHDGDAALNGGKRRRDHSLGSAAKVGVEHQVEREVKRLHSDFPVR